MSQNGDNVQYFHYEIPDEARVKVAHGVWGGVNQYGELEMCFYEESAIPPGLTAQDIGPDGMPGPEKPIGEEAGARHFKRNIHTRLAISYTSARAIMAWLDERLAEMEVEEQNSIYDGQTSLPQ